MQTRCYPAGQCGAYYESFNLEEVEKGCNMKNTERRDKEMVYISDNEVFEEQKRARKLTQQLNTMDRSDFDGIGKVVKELFGKSDGAFVNPPFYCDYGSGGKKLLCQLQLHDPGCRYGQDRR